jgi:hypothetical protein
MLEYFEHETKLAAASAVEVPHVAQVQGGPTPTETVGIHDPPTARHRFTTCHSRARTRVRPTCGSGIRRGTDLLRAKREARTEG